MPGTKYSFVVVDMPFMSYQVSAAEALHNAGRIMKETGAQAVKLEGGMEILPAVKQIIAAGIPVVGHLGLTPWSGTSKLGGFKVQGKGCARGAKVDSRCEGFSVQVLLCHECVPARLAKRNIG